MGPPVCLGILQYASVLGVLEHVASIPTLTITTLSQPNAFYSHCNVLARCFLRSERSKNKQIRVFSNSQIANISRGFAPYPPLGLCPGLTGRLTALIPSYTPLSTHLSPRPPAALNTPLVFFKGLQPLL